tara:strand:+ start:34 stop:654 length:621 start_codon:yes stop_codon:yes gene_type:complete
MTVQLDGLTLGGTISLGTGAFFSRMVVGNGTPGHATTAETCYVEGDTEIDGDLYQDGDHYIAAGKIAYLIDDNAAAWSVQESTNVYQRFITANAGELVQFHKEVHLGLSGTAGKLHVFPGTAAKGKTTLASTDNTGDTETQIVIAAQAGARTYTLTDHGASADIIVGVRSVSADGMFKDPETDTEAGFVTIDISGTEYEMPFYAKV